MKNRIPYFHNRELHIMYASSNLILLIKYISLRNYKLKWPTKIYFLLLTTKHSPINIEQPKSYRSSSNLIPKMNLMLHIHHSQTLPIPPYPSLSTQSKHIHTTNRSCSKSLHITIIALSLILRTRISHSFSGHYIQSSQFPLKSPTMNCANPS